MTYIFRKHGTSAEDCFRELTTSPMKLINLWEAYSARLVRASDMDVRAFRSVAADWEEGDTIQSRMGAHGVLRYGPWRTKGEALHPDTEIIIHLPTALRGFQELYITCPPMVFLLGMFLPLVGRVSPLLESFMYRDLVSQTRQILLLEVQRSLSLVEKLPEIHPRFQVPHPEYPEEGDYFNRMLLALAQDECFFRALRRSVDTTFKGWATWTNMRRRLFWMVQEGYYTDATDKEYHQSAVILRPGRVKVKDVLPAKKLHSDGLLQGYRTRYRARTAGLINELLCAADIGTPLEGEDISTWRKRVLAFGASNHKKSELDEVFYFIDWERWFRYRVATTGTFFTPHLVKKLLQDPAKLIFKKEYIGPEVQRWIELKYPLGANTVLRSRGIVSIPKRLLHSWKKDIPDEVSVVSGALLQKLAYQQVGKERGWTRKSADPVCVFKPKVPYRIANLHFSLDVVTDNPDVPVETYDGIYVGRTMYFRILGCYTPYDVHAQFGPRYFREQALLKGVRRGQQGYQFTIQFITENPSLFPRLDARRISQLVAFAKYTRTEVRRHNQAVMPKKRCGPQTGFTVVEDNAIIQYYRPKALKKDLEAMWTICENRTKHDVQIRAKFLRQQLIRQGVWDITCLPHQRYNARIGKEIKAAKQVAARVEGTPLVTESE